MAQSTMKKYEGPCELLYNSRALAEAQNASITISSNANPVQTMKKGLAGRSRGPVSCTIQVTNAIPKAGLEADFIGACIEDADVTVEVIIGGKRLAFDGWINETPVSFSTGAAATLSFTVMAGRPRRL